MANQTSLVDRIAAMVQEVADDVRHKVVEEPWFGRPVTDKLSDIHASLDHAQAQGKEQELGRSPGNDQPLEQAQEHDHGIER